MRTLKLELPGSGNLQLSKSNLFIHSPQVSKQRCFVLPLCGCSPNHRATALGTALGPENAGRLCHSPWDRWWLTTGKPIHFVLTPILHSGTGCRVDCAVWSSGNPQPLRRGWISLDPCPESQWGVWVLPEGCQGSILAGFLLSGACVPMTLVLP